MAMAAQVRGKVVDMHFASAWEAIADTVPDRTALICDNEKRTWREFDNRAARIAQVLTDHGLGPDSKVGIYLHNSNEYLEAQYGAFKIRGCPINVNYRYKADELAYLLDNADVEAIVYQSCYAMRIWEIKAQLPKLKLLLQVDDHTELLLDGAVDFESAILRSSPMPRIARDPQDVYMLYTGGTTGLPKGVMYPGGEFCFFLTAAGAAGRETPPPQSIAELPAFIEEVPAPPVSLSACPLMHGTGMWLPARTSMCPKARSPAKIRCSRPPRRSSRPPPSPSPPIRSSAIYCKT